MPTIEDQVKKVLRYQGEPISAKRVATLTRRKFTSVRVILRRMLDAGQVRQNEIGLYSSTELVQEDSGCLKERFEMHGLQIEAACNTTQGSLSFGAASDVTRGAHRHRINHSITYDEEWLGRIITITHHEAAEKVCVSLLSGDNALRIHEALAFASWTQGRFPGIPLRDWMVTQYAFNWDSWAIMLEGVKKVSLQTFKDIWFNIYQRDTGQVRIEAHSTKKMELSDLLDTLSLFVRITDPPEISVR